MGKKSVLCLGCFQHIAENVSRCTPVFEFPCYVCICRFSLLKAAKAVASNIMMYLPRNVKRRQLQELSLASRTHCEVEKAYLNGHLKAITVYLGDFGPP